jgi:hypothetical protein
MTRKYSEQTAPRKDMHLWEQQRWFARDTNDDAIAGVETRLS